MVTHGGSDVRVPPTCLPFSLHGMAVLPTRGVCVSYTRGLSSLHGILVVSPSPALRFLGGVGMSSVLWLTPPHANTPECPFSAVRGQGIHGAPKFPAEHRGLYKTAALKSSAAVHLWDARIVTAWLEAKANA